MCSTCGSKTYGQSQDEERKADLERLQRVLDSALSKK